MTIYELSKPYNQYADDVISGKIVACKNIKLACKRYRDWFSRSDIYMDYEDVDRRVRLVSKIKHWKGKSAGKPFILLPYQQWIFANLFGWKYKNSGLRVTKKALLFVARKAGKTALAAAICITQLLLDKNNGQEIDFVANSGQQARIGFDMTKNFIMSLDPNGYIFKRYRDSIKMPSTMSTIDVLNADGMTLDGRGASTFIEDEMAAAKNWDVWNVLVSSQGFQDQPLAIAITSANFLLEGFPCYDWRKTIIDILNGRLKDDSTFGALYELDEGDDWKDEKTWIKANPSIGETITYDYLRDQVTSAINQPSLEVAVRTKHMNQFVQSSEVWLSEDIINKVSHKVDLNDFIGEECYMGVDLAAVSDLTSMTLLFPPNQYRKLYPDKFVFKTISYVPSSTLASVNGSKYMSWKTKDTFMIIDGNVTDYDAILQDQLALSKQHNIQTIGYDAWNSVQWSIAAEAAGLNLAPYSQSLGNFNRPTKQLERLILSDRCVIDDDQCVKWCFGNVVLKYDLNENCKPTKTTRENKIDPVISMCTALGVYLDERGMDIDVI